MFSYVFLEFFFWGGKRSNLKFTQTTGNFDPQGCQEAVDTAAALILQRQWRRRSQRRSWISKLVGLVPRKIPCATTIDLCVLEGLNDIRDMAF